MLFNSFPVLCQVVTDFPEKLDTFPGVPGVPGVPCVPGTPAGVPEFPGSAATMLTLELNNQTSF